jgi:hypothetical protein
LDNPLIVIPILIAAVLIATKGKEYIAYRSTRKNWSEVAKREALEFVSGDFRILGWQSPDKLSGTYKDRQLLAYNSHVDLGDPWPTRYTSIQIAARSHPVAMAHFENRWLWNYRRRKHATGDDNFEKWVVAESVPSTYKKKLLESAQNRDLIKSIVSPTLGSAGRLIITESGKITFRGKRIFSPSQLKKKLDQLSELAAIVETQEADSHKKHSP